MTLDSEARRHVEGRAVRRRPAPAAENDNGQTGAGRLAALDTLARFPVIMAALEDDCAHNDEPEMDAYEAAYDRAASKADWEYQFNKEQEVA